MGSIEQALLIEQLVLNAINGLMPLVSRALNAAQANDQATLDSLLAQAQAASNALKPAGGVEAVDVVG